MLFRSLHDLINHALDAPGAGGAATTAAVIVGLALDEALKIHAARFRHALLVEQTLQGLIANGALQVHDDIAGVQRFWRKTWLAALKVSVIGTARIGFAFLSKNPGTGGFLRHDEAPLNYADESVMLSL